MYDPAFHIVQYHPEIASNTGSIGRTCVAIGAKLWLVRPLGFQIDDRKLKRAGLDYWPALEWEVVDDWAALEARLGARRLWFLSKKADRVYTDVRFRRGDAFVFGSESEGLPETMLETNASRTLRIPIRDDVRSLNVSVAVGVLAYEACRQCMSDLDEWR